MALELLDYLGFINNEVDKTNSLIGKNKTQSTALTTTGSEVARKTSFVTKKSYSKSPTDYDMLEAMKKSSRSEGKTNSDFNMYNAYKKTREFLKSEEFKSACPYVRDAYRSVKDGKLEGKVYDAVADRYKHYRTTLKKTTIVKYLNKKLCNHTSAVARNKDVKNFYNNLFSDILSDIIGCPVKPSEVTRELLNYVKDTVVLTAATTTEDYLAIKLEDKKLAKTLVKSAMKKKFDLNTACKIVTSKAMGRLIKEAYEEKRNKKTSDLKMSLIDKRNDSEKINTSNFLLDTFYEKQLYQTRDKSSDMDAIKLLELTTKAKKQTTISHPAKLSVLDKIVAAAKSL